MPLYVYKCPECREKSTRFLKLANYRDPQYCEHDNSQLNRVIVAPAIVADIPGYSCPVTGKWIEGRRAHEENLKRTDSRLLEPGETEEKAKARAAADEALERSLDATVEREVATMPTRKRERLFEEVAAGADLTVTRK